MNFVLIGLILSYFRLGFWIGLTMTFYFWVIGNLAGFMIVSINRDLLMTITKVMFVGGWILQFIGHYIEGRKPALLDSISQAFFQAPLFSLEVLLPGLFKN